MAARYLFDHSGVVVRGPEKAGFMLAHRRASGTLDDRNRNRVVETRQSRALFQLRVLVPSNGHVPGRPSFRGVWMGTRIVVKGISHSGRKEDKKNGKVPVYEPPRKGDRICKDQNQVKRMRMHAWRKASDHGGPC